MIYSFLIKDQKAERGGYEKMTKSVTYYNWELKFHRNRKKRRLNENSNLAPADENKEVEENLSP
jgi:hypothetical protein